MANKFLLQQIGKRNILFYLVSLLLVVIFIGPFLNISQYIFLSQDDFCRTDVPWNLYLPRVEFWYLNENGRYINALMSLLPVYDLKIYRLIPVLMIISLLICMGFFVRNLCSFFGLKVPVYIAIFITVLLTIQVFIKLPFVFEFVYWYAGVTVYFVSIILILLFLNSLIVFDLKRKRSLLLISLLIILINGNNEMALVLVNLILFLIVGLAAKVKEFKSILLLNIISWFSSIPLLFASSSDARRSHFENGGNFLFSLESSFLSAASFTVKNVMGFPDILLWIGLVTLLIKTGDKGKNPVITALKLSPVVMAIFSFIALMSQMFVIYYAVGILEAYGGRIANFIHSVFILLVIINLINLVVYMKGKWQGFFKRIKLLPFALIILSLFLIYNGFKGANYNQVIYDLNSGKAEKYKDDIEERLKYLASTNETEIEFETIYLPKTITNFDLRTVPYWENECFINMVNKRYNKKIESIIRIE